jgi:hypothetical protein
MIRRRDYQSAIRTAVLLVSTLLFIQPSVAQTSVSVNIKVVGFPQDYFPDTNPIPPCTEYFHIYPYSLNPAELAQIPDNAKINYIFLTNRSGAFGPGIGGENRKFYGNGTVRVQRQVIGDPPPGEQLEVYGTNTYANHSEGYTSDLIDGTPWTKTKLGQYQFGLYTKWIYFGGGTCAPDPLPGRTLSVESYWVQVNYTALTVTGPKTVLEILTCPPNPLHG